MPRISVSSRPRARSRRSVKTWPRSGSLPSCASSIAAKANSLGKMPSWLRSSRPPVTGIDFGGAQHIARALGDDAFLAGNQRNLLRALDRHHPLIDLARQQPQREADHPRRMGAHPLDREIGLAGIGRAEDRPDQCCRRAAWEPMWHRRREVQAEMKLKSLLTLFRHTRGREIAGRCGRNLLDGNSDGRRWRRRLASRPSFRRVPARFSLVVDLGDDLFSRDWWRGAGDARVAVHRRGADSRPISGRCPRRQPRRR